MNNAIESMESSLRNALKEIPSEAQIVVEGGHLTLQVERVHATHPGRLETSEDSLLLLALAGDPPELPGELVRLPSRGARPIRWVALVPGAEDELDLTENNDQIVEIYQVSFVPSATQHRSLQLALLSYRELACRVVRTRLGILIGDFQLELPQLRRELLKWCVPQSYSKMFNHFGIRDADVILFSEASCRNQGKRRLFDTRKKWFRDPSTADRIYKERGYTVFRDPLCGSAYLSSDYTLELGEFPYLVAITKDHKTATCGLILAGKLHWIAKQGFTHFLSIYDLADDPQIRRKNIDGSILFGHFSHDEELAAIFLTSNTWGGRDQIRYVDRFSTDDLRVPGRLSSRQELLEETRRRNVFPGLDFVDAATPSSCCVLPRPVPRGEAL